MTAGGKLVRDELAKELADAITRIKSPWKPQG